MRLPCPRITHSLENHSPTHRQQQHKHETIMLQVAVVALRRRLVLAALPSVSAGAAAAVGGPRRLGLASLAHHTTQQQQHLQVQQQQQSHNSLVWARAFHASTSSRMMAEVVMTVPRYVGQARRKRCESSRQAIPTCSFIHFPFTSTTKMQHG